jgi:hypothetical protein
MIRRRVVLSHPILRILTRNQIPPHILRRLSTPMCFQPRSLIPSSRELGCGHFLQEPG